MKRNRILLAILIVILLCGCLFIVNRDIKHFEYEFVFSRTFVPGADVKGNYTITNTIVLKPGTYHLSFTGNVEGKGSGYYLIDSNDEIFISGEFQPGMLPSDAEIKMGDVRTVRIGLYYDPASGSMESSKIRLTTDNVLFKDSILRHAFLSGFCVLAALYALARILFPSFWERFEEYAVKERTVFYLIAISLIISYPLFDGTICPDGDDIFFHLSRIEGLAASLSAGNFPARIYLNWMADYGVGCGLFYPDLFVMVPALLRLLGFSLVGVYKAFFVFCTFFSALTAYLSAKAISGNKRFAGIIAATLYCFSTYRVTCIYFRAALGELQAFIFMPLIIWGLYEIFHGNSHKWLLFAFGFWGLLCSHLISVAIAAAITAVFLLCNIVRVVKDRRVILRLVLSVVIVCLAGAFFLLPMFEQYGKVDLYITNFVDNPSSNISKFNTMAFYNIFNLYDAWGCDGNGDHPYPGWPMLAAFLLRIFLLIREPKKRYPVADRILLTALIVLIACTKVFPWQFFNWFLFRIQFSWRFLTPASALLAISAGYYLAEVVPQGKEFAAGAITLAVCLCFAIPLTHEARLNHSQPVGNLTLYDKQVTGAEYIPRALPFSLPFDNLDKVLSNEPELKVLSQKRNGLSYTFTYELPEKPGKTELEFPQLYYYGYQAEYIAEDGEKTHLETFAGPNGLTAVNITDHPSGTLRSYYRITKLQRIGDICSGMSILGIALWLLISRRKEKAL